jgi:hypothetical protein
MTGEEQSTKKTRWHLYVAGALLVVLAIGMGGQWWLDRPKRSAWRFIAVLSGDKANEAKAMLRDASAMVTDGSGNVTIQGADGTSATLTGGEWPLFASGSRVVPGSKDRNGMGDYLARRYYFQMSSAGPAVMSGEKSPVEVDCVAQGDGIVIQTVRRNRSAGEEGTEGGQTTPFP